MRMVSPCLATTSLVSSHCPYIGPGKVCRPTTGGIALVTVGRSRESLPGQPAHLLGLAEILAWTGLGEHVEMSCDIEKAMHWPGMEGEALTHNDKKRQGDHTHTNTESREGEMYSTPLWGPSLWRLSLLALGAKISALAL